MTFRDSFYINQIYMTLVTANLSTLCNFLSLLIAPIFQHSKDIHYSCLPKIIIRTYRKLENLYREVIENAITVNIFEYINFKIK